MTELTLERELPRAQETVASTVSHTQLAIIAFTALFGVMLYLSSLKIGFLLDDYFHLNYLYASLHGHPEEMLRRFNGNWAAQGDGAPLYALDCYRPAVSVSLFTDYLLYGVKAWGYHLTNVLMFGGCVGLVTAIAWELADWVNHARKPLIALFAGMLFSAYPLHVEAVAWIVGRVDVQCTLFYLVSVLLWLKAQRAQNTWMVPLALISFFVSLCSKEMAVTLPAVLTTACFLQDRKRPEFIKNCISKVGSFWLLLVAFAIFRTSVLGTIVGGYGATDKHALLHALRNFTDKPTLLKLLFGSTEELAVPAGVPQAICAAAAVCLIGLALAVWRAVNDKLQNRRWSLPSTRLVSALVFLLVWTAVSIAPTFQIWHVYPNLAGSRLFFLGSAPFCIAMAFAVNAIPTTVGLIAASTAVIALTGAWASAMNTNVQPWLTASDRVQTLRQQVATILNKAPKRQQVMLVDAPQDFKGAPMIGRFEFLKRTFSPPFTLKDDGDRLITAECTLPGHSDCMNRLLLNQALAKGIPCYSWDGDKGCYSKVSASEQFCLQRNVPLDRKRFAHIGVNSAVPFNIELPTPDFQPRAVGRITLTGSKILGVAGSPALGWETDSGQKAGTLANATKNGVMTFYPGRFKCWTLSHRIKRLYLEVPAGNYTAALKTMTLTD